ncbi:MAG TPA: hypothetical protein VI603_18265 [Saprospiraceae bacterium]|nr:hypothetical protein [Saprospiraceae bacterium]
MPKKPKAKKSLKYPVSARIFELIRNQTGKYGIVEEVAEVLGISVHTAYKKSSGGIDLSTSDLQLLCTHFNLNAEHLFSNENSTQWSFAFSSDKDLDRMGYLRMMNQLVDEYVEYPNLRLWSSGIEIPLFQDYYCPELVAFKFYVNNRLSVSHDQRDTQEVFSIDKVHRERAYPKLLHTILNKYHQINTVEFWNPGVLDVTLNQISYCVEKNLFADPADAFILIQKITDLLDHIQSMLAFGRKQHIGETHGPKTATKKVQMYLCEIAQASNLLFAEWDHGAAVFTSFVNPNFIVSHSSVATEYVRRHIQTLEQISVLLEPGSPAATKLFNSIMEKITATKFVLKLMTREKVLAS